MTERVSTPYLHLAPRTPPGADVRQFSVSPQDAYVWSRVDGVTTLGQLADMTGLDSEVCLETLDRLHALGLVSWPDDALPQRALDTHAIGPPRGVDDALQEPGDLSEAERRNILKVEQSLPNLNHWELLGVTADTAEAGLKKAYHHASKLYHPDRYHGKKLGSFQGRLERIFEAMHKAYETLSDPRTAQAYRQQNPPRSKAASASTPSTASDPTLEAHRQQIIAERKAREKARFAGPVQGQASRAQALFEQGKLDAAAGKMGPAARAFAAAADLLPARADYTVRAAQAHALANDFAHARVYIDRAISIAPKRRELLLLAAAITEQGNHVAAALGYLRMAATLDAEDPHVTFWIDRLNRKS